MASQFGIGSMTAMFSALQGLGAQYWWRRFLSFVQDPSAGGHTRAALRQAKCFEDRYGRSLSRLPVLMALPRRQRWLPFHSFGQKQISKHGPLRPWLCGFCCCFFLQMWNEASAICQALG